MYLGAITVLFFSLVIVYRSRTVTVYSNIIGTSDLNMNFDWPVLLTFRLFHSGIWVVNVIVRRPFPDCLYSPHIPNWSAMVLQ
ncbi:hypothetical protein BT63DRAFT_428176 [Microthyrium microscopicum]|uniref:Uncharacterized protein n=1 Tax=Microthyrium microscopicum TaxID=703497 RepID=A0A6A6U433_9PEZI|nr:hypothetical protein BT63DRAFT_428176 [Microthyrium microscopicum]